MRALIIEDNKDLATLWQFTLEYRGATVLHATSGAEAEHQLTANGPFDLILSDLHLGPTATLGCLDYARIRNPDATIVLITGTQIYTQGELHGLAPAADWILRKPVPVSDLEAVLDHLARPSTAVAAVAMDHGSASSMPV